MSLIIPHPTNTFIKNCWRNWSFIHCAGYALMMDDKHTSCFRVKGRFHNVKGLLVLAIEESLNSSFHHSTIYKTDGQKPNRTLIFNQWIILVAWMSIVQHWKVELSEQTSICTYYMEKVLEVCTIFTLVMTRQRLKKRHVNGSFMQMIISIMVIITIFVIIICRDNAYDWYICECYNFKWIIYWIENLYVISTNFIFHFFYIPSHNIQNCICVLKTINPIQLMDYLML